MGVGEETVRGFLEKVAASTPTPGGGSVAALAGSLSASLSVMVGQLTVEKARAGENRMPFEERVQAARKLMAELGDLVEEDAQAFQAVITAFRLPKENEEQRSIRKMAIQRALHQATVPPLAVTERGLDLLRIAHYLAQNGTPNARSDAGVAALLAYAAVWGGALNVDINLGGLEDIGFVAATRQTILGYLDEADRLRREVLKVVSPTLFPPPL